MATSAIFGDVVDCAELLGHGAGRVDAHQCPLLCNAMSEAQLDGDFKSTIDRGPTVSSCATVTFRAGSKVSQTTSHRRAERSAGTVNVNGSHHALDRKSVVEGKRVDLGGRRI